MTSSTEIPEYLSITWPSGRTHRYHWVWLRDSCLCDSCRNSHAKQKYFDSASIPVDIRPKTMSRADEEITIIWEDNHESRYPISWLKGYEDSPALQETVTQANYTRRWIPWPGPQIVQEGTFPYAALMSDEDTLGRALRHLLQYGLIVIGGDGARDADRPCDRLCDRLAGFVDRSYFGEFFDLEVKPDDQTDSVSFSTRELPLHTDIPYYSTPPDYQFLFGLDVTASATESGAGRTRFVDGLAVAHDMQENSPEQFSILTGTEVTYRAEYPWAAKIYESKTAMIQLDENGHIARLANNPSKMYFDDVPFDAMIDFYRAYGKFKELLREDGRSYSHTWHQGDAVVFDNRRIFHGRAGFSQTITRTLRGGYFREVELLARARFLIEQGS